MAFKDIIKDAKKSLSELEKNHAFKKNNRSMKQEAEFENELGKCRGKLERCKFDFDNDIRKISGNIKSGEEQGYNTSMLEDMLWDAALGYMLVKDAIFALESVRTNASVTHAYEMLEEAMRQVTDNGLIIKPLSAFNYASRRNVYGFASPAEVIAEKQAQLEEIFAQLKKNGNIEACLKMPVNIHSERDADTLSAAQGGKVSDIPTDDNNDDKRRAGLSAILDKASAEEKTGIPDDKTIKDLKGLSNL